jgi:myo-inositol 2-dehydrogenase/D-chiro-inositol 1-dehydrogenase
MVNFALFGAGRIGQMHADNLAKNPDAALLYVYDVQGPAAEAAAARHGAKVAPDVAAVLADPAVEAVLIASSTNTHVDLMTQAAQAGKAVLCEKPIDLDIARVDRCWAEIQSCGVPIQIGFNRRYDPTHKALQAAVQAGEVGRVEQVVITSRDPSPPPLDYVKVSGGLFRDMMIHDFDLARFLLAEEPAEITALGSVMVDPAVGELDDVDSAMVLMKTQSGVLCHVNCSRRAVYGYDQRAEVFGSAGMVISTNHTATAVERHGAAATAAREPLLNFFIERYEAAYVGEINDFIDALRTGRPPAVGFEDGRRALILADAALESFKTGRTVRVVY